MTRTVNCLCDKGCSTETPHPTDRRLVVVELTDDAGSCHRRVPPPQGGLAQPRLSELTPAERQHPPRRRTDPRAPRASMSPTFQALTVRNFRLYATGGLVSNTGTWMQRVAQDWLVLELTALRDARSASRPALQFLPFLLVTPYAGLIADRYSKRTPARRSPRPRSRSRAGCSVCSRSPAWSQVWHVFVLAFAVRCRYGVRRTRAAVVRGRDGRPRRPAQRRRPQLGRPSTSAASSARRSPDS